MKIALLSHVASAVAPTGAERSLALLAEGLARRGHDVAVVAPGPWALAPALRARGVAVETVASKACWLTYWEPRPVPVVALKWLRWAIPDGSVGRLGAVLRRIAPEVVHVNCLPHLAGAEAARRSGRPVAWHIREILPVGPRRRWLARRVERSADLVVAVSEATAGWLRDEHIEARIETVHNGVDLDPPGATREEARGRLGLPADGIVAGLYGQILPHKGALEFVEAAARAVREVPGLRCVLAGPGPADFLARVDRAVAAANLPGRIVRLAPQPQPELLLAAADLVVLATRAPDPFPRAVLEAMAAGRPVAAWRSGGTPEMVEHGVTGRLVEPGDVVGLAAAIADLARDDARRAAMGSAALARARERFSLDRHVDRMESLLREMA